MTSETFLFIVRVIVIWYFIYYIYRLAFWPPFDTGSDWKSAGDITGADEAYKPHMSHTSIQLGVYGKKYLMNQTEAKLFRVLSAYLLDKDYIICPKVRVEDVVWVKKRYGMRPWSISWRLDRSHIDFLLIGKTDLQNKIAIELDGLSHNWYIARERDAFKDNVFKEAGIPLIRFNTPNPTFDEIRARWII